MSFEAHGSLSLSVSSMLAVYKKDKHCTAYIANIMRQADVYEVYEVHNHHSDDPQVVNGTAKSLL